MVFTKKSARADGKPIGKTYTLRELAAALVRFVPLAPRAAMVWACAGWNRVSVNRSC